MSDNIVQFGTKSAETDETKVPTYFDIEIVLKGDDNITLRDYGFLINNGAFYGIGRIYDGRVEFSVIAGIDEVRYAQAVGVHGA